jgi:mono/diheme cytochrome c family protein
VLDNAGEGQKANMPMGLFSVTTRIGSIANGRTPHKTLSFDLIGAKLICRPHLGEQNALRTVRRIMAAMKKCTDTIFVGLCAFFICEARATPFDAIDVEAGRELAVKACSACHAIPSQSNQERASSLSGPAFSEIAKGSKATHEKLRVFLLSTHSNVGHPGGMPSPTLTEEQIWRIAAYLSSLRDAKE